MRGKRGQAKGSEAEANGKLIRTDFCEFVMERKHWFIGLSSENLITCLDVSYDPIGIECIIACRTQRSIMHRMAPGELSESV